MLPQCIIMWSEILNSNNAISSFHIPCVLWILNRGPSKYPIIKHYLFLLHTKLIWNFASVMYSATWYNLGSFCVTPLHNRMSHFNELVDVPFHNSKCKRSPSYWKITISITISSQILRLCLNVEYLLWLKQTKTLFDLPCFWPCQLGLRLYTYCIVELTQSSNGDQIYLHLGI